MPEADRGRFVLAITGMHCNGCATAVTRVLTRVPGFTEVDFDLAGGPARVAGTAQRAALIGAVEAAGYGAIGDGARDA